ncbi:ferredoxin family protein [Anaerocolumna sp. AGMB13025]|uniref:4Fe-4S dicluster domain-containing protein n=1 Tax=Anaerocolumna sp. AGMB13025 TaxID=3039116 RepID=UPI00241CB3DE|nr:ferredoxin family protein [Anaerocolumna sp. AGMB13025]WFR59986.1 ferredoxin family protein [Anaerocolumna sp. AGMB13025]
MSITINQDKCTGCRKCLAVCPGSLIKVSDTKKAFMKYPKDCWGCTSCLKECSFGAISFYLGADIGGRGSKLTTVIEEDIVHWQIEDTNGELLVIDVNRKDSNQY